MQASSLAKVTLPTYSENELNMLIPSLMDELGIPSHLKGYNYLTLAVSIVYSNPGMIRSVTTGLYSIIADRYNTTASCVERDMRTALRAAVNSGKLLLFDNYFASALSAANGISAKSFIAMLSEKLRHNLLKMPTTNGGSLT